MKESETNGLGSFVMQSQGFGAFKLKAAAAATHWGSVCRLYLIVFPIMLPYPINHKETSLCL